MNFFRSFRSQLSRWLLRGWLLELWLRWKMKRLEHRYLKTLLAGSRGAPMERTGGMEVASLRRRVGRMLFIGDIHWESKQLIPELRKILPVDVLDLRPHLPPGRLPAREKTVEVMRNHLKTAEEPDLIFFYARSNLLSDEVFELMRKRFGCPILGMNLDDKIEFLDYDLFSDQADNYQKWARHFDLNISNVRAVADWYSDRGLPVYYMPEGFHSRHGPPAEDLKYQYEISFVGQWKPEREVLFRRLQRLGLPIEPVGFGWPNSEAGHNPEATYRVSMMNLGMGFASPSHTLTTLKTRDFECPGSGACYVTTFNWELALHYEIGREILCYRSLEELVEIFSFYRRRPEDCLKIAQAAYARCQRDHTWERRFRDLFERMEVSL